MARPLGGMGRSRSFWSPRQVWWSEPQMPAWVMRSMTAPGSGSGTSYSSITKGLPYSLQTTTRPFIGPSYLMNHCLIGSVVPMIG